MMSYGGGIHKPGFKRNGLLRTTPYPQTWREYPAVVLELSLIHIYGLSRMEAAYLVLLSEQADYTEALAERGFDAEVMDRLREFAGDEVRCV